MSERPPNEIRGAWEDVSERLTGWSRLVADRYRTSPQPARPTTGTTDRKLDDTVRDLGDQLNRAVTALGDTLRDDTAKEQLRGAMKAFGDAVSLTATETTEQIRRRVGSNSTGATESHASNGVSREPAVGTSNGVSHEATPPTSSAAAARGSAGGETSSASATDDDAMPPPPGSA